MEELSHQSYIIKAQARRRTCTCPGGGDGEPPGGGYGEPPGGGYGKPDQQSMKKEIENNGRIMGYI